MYCYYGVAKNVSINNTCFTLLFSTEQFDGGYIGFQSKVTDPQIKSDGINGRKLPFVLSLCQCMITDQKSKNPRVHR